MKVREYTDQDLTMIIRIWNRAYDLAKGLR